MGSRVCPCYPSGPDGDCESPRTRSGDAHSVRELPGGQTQLFIGLHLIHEVTSPQAFAMLREMKLPVRFPGRTVATIDHIIPTLSQQRPLADSLAEEMMAAIEGSCREHGIRLYDTASGQQGVVHVIGPELGLTQPGMTIACGDSHTSTHGAFGAIAFGIGTSQVRDVLATQCLTMARPKVRRIDVTGQLSAGVYAKDVILAIIRELGVNGGVGYAYEYGGAVLDAMSVEERLTVCNMSIEGGARCGYTNPDENDDRLPARARVRAARGKLRSRRAVVAFARQRARTRPTTTASRLDGNRLAPSVTWGIKPGPEHPGRRALAAAGAGIAPRSSIARRGLLLHVAFARRADRRHPDPRRIHRLVHQWPDFGPAGSRARRAHRPGRERRQGARRPRLTGRRAAGRTRRPARGVPLGGFRMAARGLLDVPGDEPRPNSSIAKCAHPRATGTSRGGKASPVGRTLLMSPAMVAAAAIRGRVTDVREIL